MAKQAGLGTLVGSAEDIVGYAMNDRAYFRMKGGLDKAKWKRLPSMALSRDAARLFGAASSIAAGIWKNVPDGMKRIMAHGAYNRLVAACRMLVESDGNVGDVDGFRGVDFSAEPELAALSGMRVEGGGMRVGRPDAGFDEGLKMAFEGLRHRDESLDGGGRADGAHGGGGGVAETVDSAGSAVNGFSGWGRAKKRRFCVAEPFTGKEKPDFVVEDERLGTISAFREGLAALRAGLGRPVVRRRRVWVAVCEVPTVHWVPRGKGRGGAFFLVQNGRHWLGKGQACSAWVVDDCCVDLRRDEGGEMRVHLAAGFDERWPSSPSSPSRASGTSGTSGTGMKDEGLASRVLWGGMDVRGMVDEALLEARLDTERSEVCSGVFLVMVGLEVAEKRGRHWVRVPQLCRVRVTEVEQNLEQNSLNSQNSQNWEQDSQDLEQNSLNSQNSQDLEQTRWLSGSQDSLCGDQDSGNWELRSGCLEDEGMDGVGMDGEGMDGEGMLDLTLSGMVVEFKDRRVVASPLVLDLIVWGGEDQDSAVVLGLGP